MATTADGLVPWRAFPFGPVPANLLRWHLVFARPVDAVAVDAAVELLDAAGRPVPHAFVDWPGGLWDETGSRLTLLMHPGRLKTGLVVQRNAGCALVEGHAMCLRLRSSAMSDAAAGQHCFEVQPAETRAIDITAWRVDAPEAGGYAPLRIHFDRAMDPMTLPGSLLVVDDAGERVAGTLRVRRDGRSASFFAHRPWRAGVHAWRVDPELEDLCGNRIGRPFEVLRADGAARAPALRAPDPVAFLVDPPA